MINSEILLKIFADQPEQLMQKLGFIQKVTGTALYITGYNFGDYYVSVRLPDSPAPGWFAFIARFSDYEDAYEYAERIRGDENWDIFERLVLERATAHDLEVIEFQKQIAREYATLIITIHDMHFIDTVRQELNNGS